MKARAVIGPDQGEETLAKALVLLRPERVGHVKLVAGVRGVHLAEQRAHGRVQAVWREGEVEDVRHLAGCFTRRAGVSHGERRGNAFRGKEEIAGLGAQVGIEIDGELVAAADGLGLIGSRGGWGGPEAAARPVLHRKP